MPRKKRGKIETGIYHVMMRGINKQNIFDDDEDYVFFIKILHSLVNRRDELGNHLPPLWKKSRDYQILPISRN